MTPSVALLLAVFAGFPFSGRQDAGGPPREVGILVLADEEVRAAPDWRPRITASMEAVSAEFERLFRIRLAIERFADWRSDDALVSLDLLLEKVDAETDRAGCDVILALTAQKDLDKSLVGYSMYKEGTILVRLESGPPGLDRVLEHEWGHVFGAAHVADRASVMNTLLHGRDFDALNSRIIRLHRDRTFDGCGVARVDYFVNPRNEEFWINEINTIPGSLSFYLWKPKGVSYPELLERLIQYALERAEEQGRTQFTANTGALAQIAAGGIKD